MSRTYATSKQAQQALAIVEGLQASFVHDLSALHDIEGKQQGFSSVSWLRDEGRHGGGERFETADGALFARGSVNVSQIHYQQEANKRLASATAISTIIHPQHALLPSVHIHISLTEMKSGSAYWRLMADLNPSHVNEVDKQQFLQDLQKVSADCFDFACQQGDHYFAIPVLKRHRGVAHFYLEQYQTGDIDADAAFAQAVGQAAIQSYVRLLARALPKLGAVTAAMQAQQLAYHTMYFFQVLTLDKGTTTGLLIHDQNDDGIMGSLPANIDRPLLQSWLPRMPKPQDALLQSLIDVLPETAVVRIDTGIKRRLAAAVRAHYQTHPEAINMQASAFESVATVQNHQS